MRSLLSKGTRVDLKKNIRLIICVYVWSLSDNTEPTTPKINRNNNDFLMKNINSLQYIVKKKFSNNKNIQHLLKSKENLSAEVMLRHQLLLCFLIVSHIKAINKRNLYRW